MTDQFEYLQLPEQIDEQIRAQTPQEIPPGQIIYVRVQDGPKRLSVHDIYCQCATPQFDRCRKCVGCANMVFSGWGLCCCICCYGANKLDTCEVCLSGCLMWFTSYILIGWVISCIVGCQMCYAM